MRRRIYGEENELGLISKDPSRPLHSFNYDTREFELKESLKNYLQTIGRFQPNGALIYEDCGHLECATPETTLVRDLVLASKGCEKLLEEIFSHFEEKIIVIKDNTDSATDAVVFGCHENYLYIDPKNRIRESPAEVRRFKKKFLDNFILLRISLIVISGGGVISTGQEDRGRFYLSHRARFIRDKTDVNARECPIIDTKDVSLTSLEEYHRLHISFSDPNMSEFSQYLKYGITSLALRLAEDGLLPFSGVEALNPVETAKAINADLTYRQFLIALNDGRRMRAIDVLRAFLKAAKKNYPASDDAPDIAKETLDILQKWEEVLNKLEKNPASLNRELDHIILRKLTEKYLARKGLNLSELPRFIKKNPEEGDKILTKLKYLEQRYHELSPDGYYRVLCKKGEIRRILTDEEIEIAETEPPGFANPASRCRSWARGKLIQWARIVGGKIESSWTKLIIREEDWRKPIFLTDPFEWDREDIKLILGSDKPR